MPWFALPAVVATVGLVGKLISRHLHGQAAARAAEDPPGVRTIARFELAADGALDGVLLSVAAELARTLPAIEVTHDAVRARGVEVVRVYRSAPGFSLELTRAWTGAAIDAAALDLLLAIHEVLRAHPAVLGLGWHARQDRARDAGARLPVTAIPAV